MGLTRLGNLAFSWITHYLGPKNKYICSFTKYLQNIFVFCQTYSECLKISQEMADCKNQVDCTKMGEKRSYGTFF